MSTPVTYVASQYNVPAYQDTGYAQGSGNLSSYLIALATGSLTLSGGSFPLTADADFGANFGLKSIYYKSRDANAAAAGVIRLGSTEKISWRNNANGADLALTTDASDNLTYNGHIIAASGGALDGTTLTLTATSNQMVIGTTNTTTVSFTAPASSATYTVPDVGTTANFVMTAGAQTVGGAKTFSSAARLTAASNQLVFQVSGAGNTVTLNLSSAPAGSVVYTLPDAGGAASFVMTAGTQTIAGAKTFSSAVAITATSNHIVLSTASNTLTINANSQATSGRTWSVPDISGNGTFAALEGTQTFSGAKTFSSAITISATGTVISISSSNSGAGNIVSVNNTSNTASSDSKLDLVVAGASAGNPYIHFGGSGLTDWAIGIDNPSSGDPFKISASTNVGTNDALIVTSTPDVYTVAFTDYSGTSTIVGWSSNGTKSVSYKKIGRLVFFCINIDGTSNTTTATVTLPYQNNGVYIDTVAQVTDSGTTTTGRMQLPLSSSTCTFFKTPTAGAFTNSGAKAIYYYGWYHT